MKATELRIGNYFQSNIIQQVGVEHLEFLLNDKMDHSIMKPIPLTEEWLLRFGFDDSINKGVFVRGDYDLERYTSDSSEWGFYIFEDETGAKITYVHQLQNLIFALTGEELTIKENHEQIRTK